MEPDKRKHGSYTIIEPIMGIPLDQSAKSQSNLILPDLSGFHDDYSKFSNMVLPLFWMQYVNNLIAFKFPIEFIIFLIAPQ